jgi:hypothetical protein
MKTVIDYVEVEEGLEGGSVTVGRRVGVHLPFLIELHRRVLVYALRLRSCSNPLSNAGTHEGEKEKKRKRGRERVCGCSNAML